LRPCRQGLGEELLAPLGLSGLLPERHVIGIVHAPGIAMADQARAKWRVHDAGVVERSPAHCLVKALAHQEVAVAANPGHGRMPGNPLEGIDALALEIEPRRQKAIVTDPDLEQIAQHHQWCGRALIEEIKKSTGGMGM
jgi:hypothetical protein